jgi:hypothetical protein
MNQVLRNQYIENQSLQISSADLFLLLRRSRFNNNYTHFAKQLKNNQAAATTKYLMHKNIQELERRLTDEL